MTLTTNLVAATKLMLAILLAVPYEQYFIDDIRHCANPGRWCRILRQLSLLSALVLTVSVFANAQSSSQAYISDEFANLFCTDPLRSRIDAFFVEISNNPGSAGYVVVIPDAMIPGRAERHLQLIEHHAHYRNFPLDLIRFGLTEAGDSTRFQFWIVPAGAEPPEIKRPSRRIETSTLFDASRIASVRGSEVQFGEYWIIEPCDLGFDLKHFAAKLTVDSSLSAYLLASAKNSREIRKARSALRHTANNLSKNHRIQRRRIKTIYVGKRHESEMQLWLVPKGGRVPRFRAGMIAR